jgi:hypothetical protein
VTRRWAWWLAWGVWLLTLALLGIGLAIQEIVGYATATQQEGWVAQVALLLAFLSFATVGALVASRQPRNAVGWIFSGVGLLVGLSVAGGEYANYVFVEEPGKWSGGYVAGWLYVWTWYPSITLIALLPLLFPDGRVPGRRWRPVLWGLVAGIGFVTALGWFKPGPMNDDPPWPDNPLGIEAVDSIYGKAEAVAAVFILVLLAASAASMVVRFRRSRGDERQQLKWMTFAVVVLAISVAVSPAVGGDLGDVIFATTISLVPAATAIAIFKYRLYEIDRVISRTLVYALLTVILGAGYAGLVLAGQAVFSSFAGGSNLAIAGSTLVVAALFLPVRARVQRFVDRRFYRRRYDAQRTLEAFGSRLREEIDLETLTGELRGVVQETMQPAHASLWLREARP